jgi:hypothetical protein
MIGLRHARRRAVGELSKGMARRVGLAQALINDPDLIVLDEPTSGLDPLGCREVKDLIVNLARRGKTILLSSHLLADVEDVCDRIAILYNGVIQAMGPIKELLEEPHRVRITLPEIPPESMQRILTEFEGAGGAEPEVDRPRARPGAILSAGSRSAKPGRTRRTIPAWRPPPGWRTIFQPGERIDHARRFRHRAAGGARGQFGRASCSHCWRCCSWPSWPCRRRLKATAPSLATCNCCWSIRWVPCLALLSLALPSGPLRRGRGGNRIRQIQLIHDQTGSSRTNLAGQVAWPDGG